MGERVLRVVQLGIFAMAMGLLDTKVSCLNGAAVAIGAEFVAMEVEGLQERTGSEGSEWEREDGDWGWSEAAVRILEAWNRLSARYTGKVVMSVWKNELMQFEARRPELLDLIRTIYKNEDSGTGEDSYMGKEDGHMEDKTEIKIEVKMEDEVVK